MKVFHHLSELQSSLETRFQPIVTIGNFDGMHRGHQALLSEAARLSQHLKAPWGGISFSPHPRDYFTGMSHPTLFTESQKIEAFRQMGADFICIQPFDDHLSMLKPDQFLNYFCHQNKCLSGIVVGEDFQFGANREGDIHCIGRFCRDRNIQYSFLGGVSCEGNIISSTTIKAILQQSGDAYSCIKLLGRPYMLEGFIKSGHQIGRKMNIPTLNFTDLRQLTPKQGVYACWVALDALKGEVFQAVTNIGSNPTINLNQSDQKLEAHLIGKEIAYDKYTNTKGRVYFLHRLRDEKKFNSIEELKTAINKDIQQALERLSQEKAPRYWAF